MYSRGPISRSMGSKTPNLWNRTRRKKSVLVSMVSKARFICFGRPRQLLWGGILGVFLAFVYVCGERLERHWKKLAEW